ncbi:hypothetical protein DLM86_14980 [Paenibacillus flagellatus]|uniref:Uncharacterized protein n=2 Tax=Paenibacillus flagellatus TaxID=2211139 RepID=A0A2V5KR50_9BACL|nr:hypothetical protein DLM86_14980 [Paenibacillus flagellatus]
MKMNSGDERFIALAIQTVLHSNKHRLYRLTDSGEYDSFLREMSREIVQKAQTFKTITETAVRELEAESWTAYREGVL